MANRALDVDAAAVSLDQDLGDGEAKPRSAGFAAPSEIGSIEPIEDMLQVLRVNALAGVGDRQPGVAAVGRQRDLDPPLPGRVFECVVQQEQQELPQPLAIALHGPVAAVGRAHQLQTVGPRQRAHVVAHRPYQDVQCHRLLAQRQPPSVGLGQRQETGDHAAQILRLADDALHKVPVFVDRLGTVARQQLAAAADEGEGRSQLVRRVGDEAALAIESVPDRHQRPLGQEPAATQGQGQRRRLRQRQDQGQPGQGRTLRLDRPADLQRAQQVATGGEDRRRKQPDVLAVQHDRAEGFAAGQGLADPFRIGRRRQRQALGVLHQPAREVDAQVEDIAGVPRPRQHEGKSRRRRQPLQRLLGVLSESPVHLAVQGAGGDEVDRYAQGHQQRGEHRGVPCKQPAANRTEHR